MFIIPIILITLSLTFHVISESVETQLGVLMKELQEEMKELKKIRQTDSETIRKLQEELNHYTTKDSGVSQSPVKKVTKDLNLKSGDEFWRNAEALNREADLSESQLRLFLRQFPNSPSSTEVGKLEASRHETNFLRQEVLRLSKEMAEMKVHLTDGVSLSSGRVAVRWLQATVEGLRREMKEMALSLNTSATLSEKQKTSTNFALIRSDIAALEHRMDSMRVDRERNTAVIQQLRRDVDELRLRLQESAAGQQRILVEVDSLKEELREHILLSKKKSSIFDENLKTDGISWKTREHPKFRHGQWKAEVENLHESVVNLEFIQTEFSKKLRDMQKSQVTSVLKLNSLEKAYESIMNNSEPSDVEQRIFNQRLDVIESLVNKTEHQTLDIQTKVSNITSTEIRKLHGSTMQLFNALERLESNYDRTTEDIRREISKLDYNFSQTQSDLEELSDRQLSFEQVISNMKNDITTVQTDLKSNHFRLLLVQNAVLNRTFAPGQQRALANHDNRISALESKIQSLSSNVDAEKLEIETLHRQVVEKVDDQDFIKWERAQRKVRESILQFKEDIPKIKQQQETIEEELEKFIHQLPQDCSGNSTLEQLTERPSGTYLIRSPIDDSKASVKVFCEMDTTDGPWTLIQRRSKGDTSFDKDWKHYKEGFGDIESGDFWIGNEILHKLTTSDKYVLRIDLWNTSGTYKYAEYNTFEVLHEMDNYRLVIGGYHGNASDSMNYHNGMAFSTPDRDNDVSVATHCAQFYNSGWWYNHCQYVNINGRYSTGITWYDIDGKEWSELMRVEMKIKLRTLTSFSN